MLEYITNVIVPFVETVRDREDIDDDQAALVIIDNFRGQITPAVTNLLEENILVPFPTKHHQPPAAYGPYH